MYIDKDLTRENMSNCTKYNDKLRGKCYNQKQESDACFAKKIKEDYQHGKICNGA